MKDVDVLFDAMDRRKKRDDRIEAMKKSPMEASEFKNTIINDDAIDPQEKQKLIGQIGDFRRAGLIKDDVPKTYLEAKKELAETNPDQVLIRASMMKQMDKEEFDKLKTVQFQVYYDVAPNAKIKHYSHSHGLEKSGDGIAVTHEALPDVKGDNLRTWNDACKEFDATKKQIQYFLNEIDSNRENLKPYFPEPKAPEHHIAK